MSSIRDRYRTTNEVSGHIENVRRFKTRAILDGPQAPSLVLRHAGALQPPTAHQTARDQYPLGGTNTTVETLGKPQILARGGGTGGDMASDSPELQAIIDAWPSLSDDVKTSILAMIRDGK